MKIEIGKYTNWIGPYQIAEWLTTFTINGIGDEEDIEIPLIEDSHAFGKWLSGGEGADSILMRLCEFVHKFKTRKVKVRIDNYDIWNMFETLSVIILPMLIKLKDDKHGSPFVDVTDVPEHLQISGYDDCSDQLCLKFENHENYIDESWDITHRRWDWILNELIWTFEQLQPDCDWEDIYRDGETELDLTEYPEDVGKIVVPVRWKKKAKYDWDGMRAHQDRIDNGLRLFGRYFQGMWT